MKRSVDRHADRHGEVEAPLARAHGDGNLPSGPGVEQRRGEAPLLLAEDQPVARPEPDVEQARRRTAREEVEPLVLPAQLAVLELAPVAVERYLAV